MANSAVRESSIPDYVEDYRNLSINFDKLHFREGVTFSEDRTGTKKGTILGDSLIDKYRNDLEDHITTKTFTIEESSKYHCNPWALSYDLYGTVEYWHLLLDLNDMFSSTEFTLKTVKVYDGSLPDIIDRILALEEGLVNVNIDEIQEFFDNNDPINEEEDE